MGSIAGQFTGSFQSTGGTSKDPIGGVNSQTGNYNVQASDDGKIISVTNASTVTVTLLNPPPSATFKIFVQNLGTGLVHINANGLTLDTVTGNALNMTGAANQGVYISTDGSNYFSSRGKIGPATSTVIGSVIPDGTIITVSATGAITVPKSSASVFGVVEVDNVTIKSTAGVISTVPAGSAMVQLSQQILSSPAATISFAIPVGYTNLLLVCTAKSSAAVAADIIQAQFNGDTGNNYDSQFLTAQSVSVTGSQSIGIAFFYAGIAMGTSGQAGVPGNGQSMIFAYSSAVFNKAVQSTLSYESNSGINGPALLTIKGLWTNTAAITAILLALQSGGNFTTGSQFTLYGLL